MSYPPRPPLIPGMMPFGYPPIGVMPIGMMPGMMRPMPQMHSQPVTVVIPPKQNKEEKPPATTVFVGNISDRAPDQMVRQILQRFGTVLNWKRVQGASGKLQAFGFCEFEDPESTLRCMRLLNEWQIADKKLLVKVDAKTKTMLDEHKNKKMVKNEITKMHKKEDKEDGETASDVESGGHDADEIEKRQDMAVRISLEAIMKEYEGEIAKLSFEHPLTSTDDPKKKSEILNDIKNSQVAITNAALKNMELEDDKKDMISREIRTFRELQASEEIEKSKEENHEREQRRRRDDDKERRDRDRNRDREREREREERDKERDKERRERENRSTENVQSRSKTRERSRDREAGEDEEAFERKKLERRLREKEAAYQELLRKWESRERKKSREYEKDKEKENERQSEEAKEAKRLREFLEDYDDEKDDVKYYKSSALQRRLLEREKELEADEKDRQKEREELERIRKKLLEEGHPDPEAEMARIEREREEHLMPRIPGIINLSPSSRSPDRSDLMAYDSDDDCTMIDPPLLSDTHQINPAPPVNHSPDLSPDAKSEEESAPFKQAFSEDSQEQPAVVPEEHVETTSSFGKFTKGSFNSLATLSNDSTQKRKKPTVSEVFSMEDEDADSLATKKRRLVPLDYSAAESAAVGSDAVAAAVAAANALAGGGQRGVMPTGKPTTAEEKRRCIKNLIECIPTAKEQLFEYKLDWSMVDSTLMERRVKPWVNKKIVEYIGEEEPMLSEFICKKVIANSTPASILSDITTVLDDEAEVFVVKMWRLLIYETEAKKLGLVK